MTTRKEIARWTKGRNSAVILVERPNGETLIMRRDSLHRTFDPIHIPAGHRPNGRPLYTERPTVEQAHTWALANGYEEAKPR